MDPDRRHLLLPCPGEVTSADSARWAMFSEYTVVPGCLWSKSIRDTRRTSMALIGCVVTTGNTGGALRGAPWDTVVIGAGSIGMNDLGCPHLRAR